ncbi:MAG: tRNA (adenosine(37)-N6)-dimethylallyltransferase MiaA [Bacteroidota bacterium]
MAKKNPLLVLAGPTASGKTSLAIRLAQRFGGILLSADSRQVYRFFDIGTAKATRAEREAAEHRLIDIAEPTETLTAAQYQRLAHEEIKQAHASGAIPILVGGTGFYIRSVTGGLSIPEVPPDPAFRASLQGRADLHERLMEIDPVAAGRIHRNDSVRIVRALEVFHHTGKPISQLQKKVECPYSLLYLALDWEREALYERIDARAHQMIEQGFVEEVRFLAQKYGEDLPLLRTLGYAEILSCLRGESDLEGAIALIQKNTRNYAKRQLTWFRHEEGVQWIPPAFEEAERRVEAFLSIKGETDVG